jgi:hypothetical protein
MDPVGTVLTGLISVDGEPAAMCPLDCDHVAPTKGQAAQCGRPDGHPEDNWGHICDVCMDQVFWRKIGEDYLRRR